VSAEQDAQEVRMLLAEAGYPRAEVAPARQDQDSPMVTLDPDGDEHQAVPMDVANQALALWGVSHGLTGARVLLTDEHGNPTVTPPTYERSRS
jgi:hypothetical protein